MTDIRRRIQLRRTKGWRMPENTVKVDRTTPWGNPFGTDYDGWREDPGWFVTGHGQQMERVANKAAGIARAVALHREWLKETRRQTWRDKNRPDPVDIMKELRGKNLACWCRLCSAHIDGKPLGTACDACAPCHADVLLEIANAPLRCEAV